MRFIFILGIWFGVISAQAELNLPAEALHQKIISETSPFVFTPAPFNENDFEIQTTQPSLSIKIIPKSFEWVRVDHGHVFPRAKVLVQSVAQPDLPLMIQYSGITATREVLIALTSRSEGVVFDQDGKSELGRFSVKFKPRKNFKNKIIIEPSCSPYGLELLSEKAPRSWVTLSCKMIQTESNIGTKPILELSVYWDTPDTAAKLRVDNKTLPEMGSAFEVIRYTSEQSTSKLQKGEEEITIRHHLPTVFHRFVGSVGVGPYYYRVEEGPKVLSKWVPFGTLYLAYLFSEQLKIASFWAFPADKKFQLDAGFYLIAEQFRGVDERLSLNLLLGAHLLEFSGEDRKHYSFSAPQGVEINVRDVFGRQKNLSVGGFFYPTISGRSYINSWVRWGSPGFFYEVNFIAWREPYDLTPVNSKSVGLSIGFPLFRAF